LKKAIENKGILWIMFCTLISNGAYAMIAPFLPVEFEEKGISGEWVGMIFAVYSVAVIIFSPMVGTIVPRIGARNLIALGVCTMGISFIFFGIVVELKNNDTVIVLSLSIRFL
jgi:MFS family permease